jgi:hypothetical protein
MGRNDHKSSWFCIRAGHMWKPLTGTKVKREAPHFLKHLQQQGQKWGPEIAKLRPHSMRATLITELMGEGMTIGLSMKYARHQPGSQKVHLRYGQLTLQDLQSACDALPSAGGQERKRQWQKMSVPQLLLAQKEITSELTRRNSGK